jgi:hypothetical protein
MLIVSRRVWPALGHSRSVSSGGVLLAGALFVFLAAAALAAPSALAGSAATVTVRVLGPEPNYETLTPPTPVTTTSTPVEKEGHSCSGTDAIGALNLATKGNWGGTFNGSEWFITAIDGGLYEGPFYWGYWVNNRYAAKGVCGQELEAGDQLLFLPENLPAGCFKEPKEECTPPKILSIEAPATAEVGKPITVTVLAYPNAAGEPSSAPPSPAAGVNVGGWGSSTTTNSEGKATLAFPGDETYTLRATGATGEEPVSVPGEALVCAHTGDDGECGTPRPPGGSAPVSSSTGSVMAESAPYTGPYAVVAAVSGIHEGHVYPHAKAPRVLAGTVAAHASVTSISLRLRRSYRGRCWAYSGSRERLERVRCGQGSFFQIASGGDSFSYLLPSRLPPGRYVLDIAATDSAGSKAPLDRGSSRIVFYVK